MPAPSPSARTARKRDEAQQSERDPGGRLNFRTACFWCGEEVFFFRDSNGGCALFDAFGWPWPLHPCWEMHRSEQKRARKNMLRAIREALKQTSPFRRSLTLKDGECHSKVGSIVGSPVEWNLVEIDQLGYFCKIDFDYGTNSNPVLVPLNWLLYLWAAPSSILEFYGVQRGQTVVGIARSLRYGAENCEKVVHCEYDPVSIANCKWKYFEKSTSEVTNYHKFGRWVLPKKKAKRKCTVRSKTQRKKNTSGKPKKKRIPSVDRTNQSPKRIETLGLKWPEPNDDYTPTS